ncbi:MAG: pentapeptide repeat-containing protein, partial [Coleofasciculus sp. C2-GNP5-27]
MFRFILVWLASCLIFIGSPFSMAMLPASPALALDYNKEYLVNSDFSDRVLTDASFNQADLRESNFS